MDCGLDPLHSELIIPGAVSVNLYALVGYIPAPLGEFLDGLRGHLVPGCNLRSHVSLLPPRPISSSQTDAWKQIARMSNQTERFRIELGDVQIFPETSVIYIGLAKGSEQLFQVHHKLNQDTLHNKEPFPYHPHITLAQKFPSKDLPRLREIATSEWKNCRLTRGFDVDVITFVQNLQLPGFDQHGQPENQWIDLDSCSLSAAVAR